MRSDVLEKLLKNRMARKRGDGRERMEVIEVIITKVQSFYN
ncbi:hypothetical protein [Chryseobacterium sp. BIGb0232]|nr:hypothetical protein [Chryseobacterium sp. BIGb0232]MCS4305123.1 hypothetical protein [Chryseobacterium sp. BIGb0232]